MVNLSQVLNRKLTFIHGKGGVGKTVVSQAIALRLSKKGTRTLWITLEDPTRPPGEMKQLSTTLWHFNCSFTPAFEEYVGLKIGMAPLTRLFLKNKLMRYLAQAAPGIHELVLLGKIWHERLRWDHIVIDLPSTGYGLALFKSAENFAKLFQGGPMQRDALAMLKTFHDPHSTGHLIVALPEEMPLRESLELNNYLKEVFPENPSEFVVNRLFPSVDLEKLVPRQLPHQWPSPLADSLEDYARKRFLLEDHNMRIWRSEGISFGELNFIPPQPLDSQQAIVQQLAEQLRSKGYL